MLLTPADVTDMRAMQELALPDICTVSRSTRVSDGRGGYTTTWANVLTNIPCRLGRSQTQPQEAVSVEVLRAVIQWAITTAQGTDIRDADRITIGARVFEVIKAEAHENWETARRARCVEVG